jgi:hypothetical protein
MRKRIFFVLFACSWGRLNIVRKRKSDVPYNVIQTHTDMNLDPTRSLRRRNFPGRNGGQIYTFDIWFLKR